LFRQRSQNVGCRKHRSKGKRASRHYPDAPFVDSNIKENSPTVAQSDVDLMSATLSTSLEMCPLAFAPLPPRADLEARAKSGDGFVSRHARWVLKQWPNPGDQPTDYQIPVQVVVLGQKVTLVALGGEPVVDYSIRLKRELASAGRFVWVAGYANLVNAYVPSRRVLQEGGYEGTQAVIYQSLPGPFRSDIEDRIVASVQRQAKVLWDLSKTK
jgi:neutral ceramidase